MQGNPEIPAAAVAAPSNSNPHKETTIDYAIRLTFGVVHASILTLFSFGLAFLVPSISHFLFSLFGCVIAPALSLLLAIFCNACVEYVSTSTVTWKRILSSSWIPPLGVFCASLLILPLELMPSLGFSGPVNTLVVTSIVVNFVVSALLQVYAGERIQSSSVSDAAGGSAPR